MIRRFICVSLFVGSLGSLGLLGCGEPDVEPPVEPAACHPYAADTCAMPWPSAAFLRPDPSSLTGVRVDIPAGVLPVNIDNVAVDPAPLNRWDGFSPTVPIVVRFPGGVSADGLPPFDDPDASLAADAPIVLLDLDTGVRVPFFAEVDMNVTRPEERTLIIRPLERMPARHRMGVAIRSGVKSATGGPLPVPEAFTAALAGEVRDVPRWAQATAGLPSLMTALAAEGVPATDVVLAWDWVVASDEFLMSDLMSMRTQALATIGADAVNLSFVSEAELPGSSLRRMTGTFKSPNFLLDGERDSSTMRRDADGLPVVDGLRDANFAAILPSCAATATEPLPIVIFGHGIFGSAKDYLDNGFVQDLAEQYCFAIIAGDFIGLTKRQLALAPLAANDANRSYWMSDKLEQSVIDFIALEMVARHIMPTDPAFLVDGQPVLDPSRTFYVGGSLGGTMGNTFMAYDPHITRGVLAVPGGVWSMLFERSAAWLILQGAAQGAYPKYGDQQMLVVFLGMALEMVDPITVAHRVLADPLPGTPAKEILMWQALGDSLVTNVATEMIARAMGISVLGPTVKTPWNLPVVTGSQVSGFAIYDESPDPLPTGLNTPADDNGTHSGVNQRPAVLRQIEAFVLGGEVVSTCMLNDVLAPCDCSTGACD